MDETPEELEQIRREADQIDVNHYKKRFRVLKAIALGARCVLLGRPYGFGLAVGGEDGVREVLLNLVADLDLTLGLTGCSTFAELSRANLVAVSDPPGSSEL